MRQFYPENVAHEARLKMRELKHTRSIQDYVQEFFGLMLQIPNMSDDDLLFNFTAGLKQWTQLELQRRGVKDISSTLTVAETLVEYTKPESSNSKSTKDGQGKGGVAKWAKESKDSKTPRNREVGRKMPRKTSSPGTTTSFVMGHIGRGIVLRGRALVQCLRNKKWKSKHTWGV